MPKREFIDSGSEERCVRRAGHCRSTAPVDAGHLFSREGRTAAETVVKPGDGDRGDRI